MITAAEWGFLALLAKKRGTIPKGNTNFGKDSSESLYLAIPTSREGDKTGRTATGTGPLTWSDTGDATGAFDLNGNVWEWCAGIRLVRGELQVIPYNNAADPTVDMGAASTAWKALNATAASYNDLYITPNGAGTTSGSVKLDFVDNHWHFAPSVTSAEDATRTHRFNLTTASGLSDFCLTHLQALALFPEDNENAGYFYVNNGANEMLMHRGGGYSSGGGGIFSIHLDHPRSDTSGSAFGFRATFVEL